MHALRLTTDNGREFTVLADSIDPEIERHTELVNEAAAGAFVTPYSPYDSAGRPRSEAECRAKAMAGNFAELWVRRLFEGHFQRVGLDVSVEILAPDRSDGDFEQIDLNISSATMDRPISVELRSSFPFNAESAIQRNFDIIGPYANRVKSRERPKDLYARVLFDLDMAENSDLHAKRADGGLDFAATASRIIGERIMPNGVLTTPFTILFSGGATHAMMLRDPSYIGTLAGQSFSSRAKFRLLRIKDGMDAQEYLTALDTAIAQRIAMKTAVSALFKAAIPGISRTS